MSSNTKRKLSCDEKSCQIAKISSTVTQTLSCPITLGLLVDPVLAEDGQIYERKAIEQWLKSHDGSPLNPNMNLKIKNLTPVRIVQQSIEELIKSNAVEEDLVEQWNTQKKEYDLSKAGSLYRKGLVMDAAKLGHPKAQGEVSAWYWDGKNGMEVNHVKAVEWAEKAVEGGDMLGTMYMAAGYQFGAWGVKQDVSKAIDLFKKVAEQEYSIAMYSKKEVAKICSTAMKNLGDIYRCGCVFGCELDHDNFHISADWYHKSASAGCVEAMLAIGELQLLGEGVTKDPRSAWKWFSKVKGDKSKPEADFEMGKMLMKGEGVFQNMSSGFVLIERSASKGFSPAEKTVKNILSQI